MNPISRVRRQLRRRRDYRAVFLDAQGKLTEAGEAVLADLARFAHVYKSTARVSPVTRTVDVHATMLAEGRRDLFNRIAYYLNLSESQMYAILESEYGKPES